MRGYISVFAFFLLGIGCLQAQSNFVKGYYVTSSQDTIHGYLDYRFTRLKDQVVFKEDSEGSRKRFTPADPILAFAFENQDFYENHTFKPTDGYLIRGFFRVLLKGKLSLLKYNKKYYLKTSEGQLYNLSSTKVVDGVLGADLKLVGTIKLLMSECESISTNDLEEEFKKNGNFESFIRQFNECVGYQNIASEKVKIAPHFGFGLTGSALLMNMQFGSALANLKLDFQPNYSFGIYTSAFLSGMNENIRAILEFTYLEFSDYGFYNKGPDRNFDVFFNYTSWRIPLFLRYNSKKLFFDAGINQIFILDQDMLMRQEIIEGNRITTINPTFTPLSQWNPGLLVGLGIRHDIFGLPLYTSARYTHSLGLTHPYKPTFQNLEFNLALPLVK